MADVICFPVETGRLNRKISNSRSCLVNNSESEKEQNLQSVEGNVATAALSEGCDSPHRVQKPGVEGVTILPSSSLGRREEGAAPSNKSSSLSQPAQPGALSGGARALVLLEDVCRNPDVSKMVKKQLAKGVAGGSDKSASKVEEPVEARDGTRRKASSQGGGGGGVDTGDRTVSSTTPPCGKNIFEKLMAGRKSPRRQRSNSPRCPNKSGSVQDDSSDARSSSEEKQQMSIATAVKALRGLSGKVAETSGKSRLSKKDKETVGAKSPRHASPSSSTSPKCQNSVSPKRQSPRRMAEKMSPPAAAGVQKWPKARKSPSSCAALDGGESPSAGRRVKSPRRGGELVTSGLISLDSSWNSQVSENSSADGGKKTKGGKCVVAGQKYSVEAGREEHTIHIMSSTSWGSKVIQVERQRSPVCAIRKLFVDTRSDSLTSGKRTVSPGKLVKCNSSSSCGKDTSEKQNHKTGPSSSSAASSCLASPNSGVKKLGVSGADESLLCAMLIGGNEVTQSYEKSREQKISHSNTAMSECSDSMDWKPSETNSFLSCNDSFFDDDVTGNMPEEKPYELPVLSQLPPIGKPNLAVMELMTTETSSPEPQHNRLPPGHRTKTQCLLQLISRITESLPAESKACQMVITDARKLLSLDDGEQDMDTPGSQVVESEREDEPRSQSTDREDRPMSQVTVIEDQPGSQVTVKEGQLRPAVTDRDGATDQTVSSSSSQPECVADTLSSKDTLDLIQSSEVDAQMLTDSSQKLSDMNTGDGVDPMETEVPDSPSSSLGELDTTQMTKDATQAVQNQEVIDSEKPSVCDVTDRNCGQTTVKPLPGPSWDSCQSSATGLGTESEDTSKPGPSGRGSSSQPQTRSFFSRFANPSQQRWKPKVEVSSNPGRPGWSKWHTVVSPEPITVLKRLVKSFSPSRLSPFISQNLDNYLNQTSNRYVMPACKDSGLAKILLEEGHVRDYHQLQKQISREEEEMMQHRQEEEGGGGCKSEEEEDGEDDNKDYEVGRKLDPDFDEVEGLVFVSFPSEVAVKAHLTLENTQQWEGNTTAYLNMARFHAFEESRRKEGKIRRESQGLRGQHMKWRRYQRLYRKELRCLYDKNNKDAPSPLPKLPEKTSDIHKIKNWKQKFGSVKSEDMEALELLGEDEERIKRKRKTYVFSSKKKKFKRTGEILEVRREPVKESLDTVESGKEEEEEEDGYGVPIPIDEDQYMEEVNSSIEELRLKEKGLKQSKGIFARFKMGPEDRHIFKKLGGWNSRFRRFRRMPQEMKDGDGPTRPPRKKAQKKDRHRLRFELKFVGIGLALSAVKALHTESGVNGRRQTSRESGSHGNSTKTEGGDLVDLTIESPCDLNSKKLNCDKPGCRYSCICHLCLPSVESDEVDQAVTPVPLRRTCDKEYCRLGCICDSLEKSGDSVSRTETSQQDVELGERGQTEKDPQPLTIEKDLQPLTIEKEPQHLTIEKDPQPLTSIKQEMPLAPKALKAGEGGEQAESSGDELPTLEKTMAPRRQRSIDRYSNLPRRQTSYRMAKNLDAVSRKAMMMWEMSEVYSEQTTTRRKKVSEPGSNPAVTTSSPSVPQSPAITSSSPLSSSSSSSLITSLSITHTTTMVTTAVSVNTLPAIMTSLPVPCSLSTISPSPTATAVKTSPQETAVVCSSASNSVLDTSPVVVSDDEGKPDTQTVADTSVESTPLQVKRSRKRRKVVSNEAQDVESGAPPRTKVTPGSSAVSPINLSSSSLSSSSPEETTRACSCPGPVRQWHTTLICLKANNPTTMSHVSDDVMEEDEIKLVEMIFNCAWEGSKEQILKAITSNVKRGLYPDPRVQIIGGFRVEILPKAAKPSAIPMELRSKLPKYMFPVRVKVTEHLKQVQKASEVAHSKDCEIVTPSDASKLKSVERAKRVWGDCEIVKLERASREALKPTPSTGMTARPTSTPSTPLSSVHGRRVPLQGVVPRAGLQGGSAPLSCVLSTPSGAGVGSDTVHTSSMGISGLGHLQISQNKSSVSLMASHGQVLQQHFKIQKKEVVPSPDEAGGGGEKKRKKKKKKKNMLGDDSLVPDLSNLSVSPRSHAAHLPSPIPLTSTPLASSTPNNSPHGPSVKEAVVVRPTQMSQPFPLQPVSHLVSPPSSLRPQVLGFPSLPATLNNVKFLQLPGQNNLLQIVPASALGLKPMDNKNIPNFVAVPVSLTSIAHQNLGPPANKRSSSGKVQGDPPSRVAPSTQPHAQDLSQPSASVGNHSSAKETGGEDKRGNTNTHGDGGHEMVVKKKKKKKKKAPVDESPLGESQVPKPVGPLPSSTLLVAGSPSPVMSCAGSYPVHSMINTHGMQPTLPASLPLGSGASCTSPQKSTGVPDVHPTLLTATPQHNHASLLQPSAESPLGSHPSVSERVPSTTGTSHSRQEGGVLAGSNAEGQTSVGPSTSSISVPSSSCGLDRGRASSPHSMSSVMHSLQEERLVAALDQDSKEPWLDNVDLSSSEEDGLDVGTEPPAPDDVTSQLLGSRSAQEIMDIKRNCEQRRRDDLKVWFRKLKGVMSVDGATLPKDISQAQILKKAVSIIKYHEKWMQSQAKILEEQKKQRTHLLRQLQTDIDKLLSQGLPQSTIDQLLTQFPLPADLNPFQIPCPLSTTLHLHPSLSTSSLPPFSVYQPLDPSTGRCRDMGSKGEGKGQSSGAEGSTTDPGPSGDRATAHSQKSCSQAGLQSSRSETQCLSAQGHGVKSGAADWGPGGVSGNSTGVEQSRPAGPGCEEGKSGSQKAEVTNVAGRRDAVDKHRDPSQERDGAEHHGHSGEGVGERLIGRDVEDGKKLGAATIPDPSLSLPQSVPWEEEGCDEVDGGWNTDSGQDSGTSPDGMQVPVVRDDIPGVADPPHSRATDMGPAQQEESAADNGLGLVITSVMSLRYLGRNALEAQRFPIAGKGSEKTSALVSEGTSAHVSEGTSAHVSEGTSAHVSEGTSALVSEGTSAHVTKETSAHVTEETSAHITKETSALVSEKTSALVSEGTSALVSEGTSALVSEGTSAHVSEGTSAHVSEGMSALVSEGTSALVSEGTSAHVSEGTSAHVSEGTSAHVSEGTSALVSEGTSAHVSEGTSAHVSEGTSAHVSEGTSALVSEGTSALVSEGTSAHVSEGTSAHVTKETSGLVSEETSAHAS